MPNRNARHRRSKKAGKGTQNPVDIPSDPNPTTSSETSKRTPKNESPPGAWAYSAHSREEMAQSRLWPHVRIIRGIRPYDWAVGHAISCQAETYLRLFGTSAILLCQAWRYATQLVLRHLTQPQGEPRQYPPSRQSQDRSVWHRLSQVEIS
ncbi:hypothetical protein BU26DRAFT_520540 [Trematosphaeria pertusa]|uniref:Uncharacterized protein n=1 Tax=Trematosphaeria pertusa TaxID=390896 RepID=A0A6A6ICS9_9PLEO|nr:uncharacterized protein BU26DRAFT_520540 [Trematosphaeria pertusa]KAF2247360.1 hypothetical protein BU26DRAFT_520540 [Trematosphaeria pertusa]